MQHILYIYIYTRACVRVFALHLTREKLNACALRFFFHAQSRYMYWVDNDLLFFYFVAVGDARRDM